MEELISRQRIGFTLEQAFTCSDELFHRDIDRLISQKWLLVDHISRIPEKGCYFLFEIAGESILIIRADDNTVNAFFNVCRHRGSRICQDREGKKNILVCPYHAWSYGLDGSLRDARLMPADFNKKAYGLHPCHIQVYHGLIFICLSQGSPPDFNSEFAAYDPMLDFHGFEDARIAVKRNYPTAANWKLVVENFIECYHCGPAHPEYCAVHPEDQILAIGAGPGSGPEHAVSKYNDARLAWLEKVKAMGHPSTEIHEDENTANMGHAYRFLINDRNFQSETRDGQLASKKLMGNFKECDGGQTVFSFNPLGYLLASNDHVMMIRFTPRETMLTDVEINWLVHKDAEEVTDYDPENLAWFWDVTTKQDQFIAENNQTGIRSSRYQPGRYSEHEARVVMFLKWYLKQIA